MVTYKITTGNNSITIKEGDSLEVASGYSYVITDAKVNWTSIWSEYHLWPFATPDDFLSYEYTTAKFDYWPNNRVRG